MPKRKKNTSAENKSVPTKTLSMVPPPRGARHSYLHISPGDRVFPLKGQKITVGSAPSNSLPIADPSVSRKHCVLERTGRRWWIRDLKSKNAVFVNKSKIRDAELGTGDTICIGGTTLRLTGSNGVSPNLKNVRKCQDMVAQSPAMLQLFYRIEELAKTTLSLIIIGESGTGKELVAKACHELSFRAPRPFVPLNCGALPLDLLEAELFGYERGAFTGADRSKPGVFEYANGGTIFLDEIGELPMEQQPALLRVLDSGKIRRLGSNRLRNINVRVLCATNKNLKTMVQQGCFRKDLYFRLAECTLWVPPLRKRPSDVVALVDHFLKNTSPSFRAEDPPQWLMDKLMKHSWPGNVRELRNLVRRATALGWEKAMEEDMVSFEPPKEPRKATPGMNPQEEPQKQNTLCTASQARQPNQNYNVQNIQNLLNHHSLESIEKAMLAKALESAEGNQTGAAELLNMKRSTFRLKLKRHKIV